MPNGLLIVESTANSFNDHLHQLLQEEDNVYRRVFIPWYKHEDFRKTAPPGWQASISDLDYARVHGLDSEQVYWKVRKRQEIGEVKFQREYPATIDEAYSIEGDTFIAASDMEAVEINPGNIEGWTYLPHVKTDKPAAYVIGADAAGGGGGDYSSLYVIDVWSREPVATWRSNTTVPKEFARIIQETASKYDNAKVLVESNTPGDVVLAHLRTWGGTSLWLTPEGKDWNTNTKTKPMGLHQLRADLLEGRITILDNVVYKELRSLTIKENGTIHFPYLESGHCDSVTALYLANHCASTYTLPKQVNRIQERLRATKAQKMHGTKRY